MKNILLLLTAAPLLLHAAVIYETDFTSADGWTPWKIAKDSLRFDQSGFTVELKQRNNGFSGIRREIPVENGCGYLKLSATFSADKVLPGRQGPKIQAMLQFSGKTEYPGVKTPAGSYPERRAEKVFFCDGKLRKLFLNVGLQETAGKFHLRNLRLEQFRWISLPSPTGCSMTTWPETARAAGAIRGRSRTAGNSANWSGRGRSSPAFPSG